MTARAPASHWAGPGTSSTMRANAMVTEPDTNYLYYGWWVSKNKDGMPTDGQRFCR